MFTKEEVIQKAREKYGKPICIDYIEDAMKCDTIEEAVELILIDSYYWNNLFGKWIKKYKEK